MTGILPLQREREKHVSSLGNVVRCLVIGDRMVQGNFLLSVGRILKSLPPSFSQRRQEEVGMCVYSSGRKGRVSNNARHWFRRLATPSFFKNIAHHFSSAPNTFYTGS